MEVDKIYQDDQGKWHIEYSPDQMIGLAFRVYYGQLFINIFIIIPLALLITHIASAKSLHEEKNTAPPSNSAVRQESISNELSN